MYEEIISLDNLFSAYREFRRGKRARITRETVLRFNWTSGKYLIRLTMGFF